MSAPSSCLNVAASQSMLQIAKKTSRSTAAPNWIIARIGVPRSIRAIWIEMTAKNGKSRAEAIIPPSWPIRMSVRLSS